MSTGQHLGIQQLLVMFLVGKSPGITRSEVRDYFARYDLPHDGIDRRLRELDEKNYVLRARTAKGTSLRLSKAGQQECDRLSPAFREALKLSKRSELAL